MNREKYDGIQLLSVGESTEIYYQMLTSAMTTSAADKRTHSFDGNLQESSQSILSEFAENHDIPLFSQTLMNLMTTLEWCYERKTPPIQETAIYNSLLRLEKVLNQCSSWELFGKDYEGPELNISTFEANLLEQNMSMYVTYVLQGNTSEKLFFPLTDIYQSDTIVKWRILEKIASLKLTPERTIYKRKLTEELTNRIENEVKSWLQKEFQKLKLAGKNTALKDAETLTKILKEMKTQITMCADVVLAEESLFEEASCSYFERLANSLNKTLYPVCLQIMKAMDTYQEYHRSFHVNLRDSCALSHGLYRQIKTITDCLQTEFKTSEIMDFRHYSCIFIKFFMNILQVMKSECHFRIKRALDVESKDAVLSEERIYSSTVIVLNCFCTVIDEWKHMEIDDEDLQITFLIKISDVICDGAKIFAESLDNRLVNESLQSKDFAFTKKACILANSVQHVREYLLELPKKMKWEDSLSDVSDVLENSLKNQVLRILNLIHQSMDLHLQQIIMKMMEETASSLITLCDKQLNSWLHNPTTNQTFERVQCHINEHLETLNEMMRENLFPEFLVSLWSSILAYVKKGFIEGEPPEYAETLKEDLENFHEYFTFIKMPEKDSFKPLWQEIISVIELNSKTTVDLQLDYYSRVAESIVSPVEYLGHIAFQAGYKIIGEDYIDLYINVQKGQRLPARSFEMSELHVKLALCPHTMFPNHIPLKSMSVTEDLDNPVFNQFFQFAKLPSSVLSVKGAVVQVHVLNQDNTFSAEAVLLLKQVQNMSGFSSLEFLPVYLMPLKKFDMSEISFQLLESRSRWDKSAKHFINSRIKISKGQKKLLPCIPRKSVCFM